MASFTSFVGQSGDEESCAIAIFTDIYFSVNNELNVFLTIEIFL